MICLEELSRETGRPLTQVRPSKEELAKISALSSSPSCALKEFVTRVMLRARAGSEVGADSTEWRASRSDKW